MRRALIGLALMLAAMPAGAQIAGKTIDNCGNKNVDISIAACTAMLTAKPVMSTDWRLAAYYARGQSYSEKGLEDRAIADFTSAMALRPELQTLVNLQGSISMSYIRKHLYAESIASSSKMIELKPDDADGYQLRGYAYELDGQRDQAIADYRTTLKFHPDAENVKQALTRLGVTP
jgi:tetratricopeptide (TPR) repeat protein